MATAAGDYRNRVYSDQPVVPGQGEPFKVRARLTALELFALAAVIGVCASLIGYEYGVRRPAREAAAAAKAHAAAPRAVPAPTSMTPAPGAAPAAMTTAPAASAGTATVADSAAANVSAVLATTPSPAATRGSGERTRAGDDPFQTPGTIYRCRRYDGSLFWSSLHCAKHRGALIERIARVPPDAPFDTQVRIASEDAKRVESSLRAEQAEIQRMNTCASLVGEQAQILRRAGDATVLTQVQATDRARAREIEATLQRLRCNG
jgi:hypothetical protein